MTIFPFARTANNIRYLPIPGHILMFSIFEDTLPLKLHPQYFEAKAGNFSSALGLIKDLAWDEMANHRHRFSSSHIFVSPFAKEASGDNALPQVLAEVFAFLYDAKADQDLVQNTKVFHTGADPMERLILRAEFEGSVQAGAQYVLVDDVIGLGGTLAELAHYVQINGGLVSDIAVMVNAGRIKSLRPDHKILKILKDRFDNEIINLFGIHIDALTANEAQYLVGFRTIVEIRNRIAKAKKEVNLRLRSKGIEDLFDSHKG